MTTAARITELRALAESQPLEVDVSDYGDEWVAGFLQGQAHALDLVLASRPQGKPVVYLAGPYSNPDPVWNMHDAIKLADRLLDMCTPIIPHLSGTWHMVSPKPYEQWLRIDLDVMRRCDVVFRFGGASSGADAEVVEAERVGIPVVYSEAELYRALEGNQS